MDNKTCTGKVISFNCLANANPGVTSYQLFEDKTAILNTSASGLWNKTWENEGVFVYKCVANNSVGSEYSTSVTVTVNGKQTSPSYAYLNHSISHTHIRGSFMCVHTLSCRKTLTIKEDYP